MGNSPGQRPTASQILSFRPCSLIVQNFFNLIYQVDQLDSSSWCALIYQNTLEGPTPKLLSLNSSRCGSWPFWSRPTGLGDHRSTRSVTTTFSKMIVTLILRFHYKYAGEMALKSQKCCTLQYFRASKNLEKSSQSGQNANKSSILRVHFTVTTVA